MKTKLTQLKKLALVAAFLVPFNGMAQDELNDLFSGAPEDAGKLVMAYIKPLNAGFGLGLNSQWYSSATAKKLLRFDIKVTASGAMVPTADKSFDVTKLGLTSLVPTNNNNVISPTLAGAKTQGVEMMVKNNINSKFNLPEGQGVTIIPAPQAQFTIGLPLHTELSVRYMPTIDIDQAGKIGLFGIGGKVEVLPLILGKTGKILPFNLAVAVGYTKLKWDVPLEVGNIDPNQKLAIEFSGLSYDAIISKNLSIFTPYLGLGYQSTTSSYKALGNYEFDVPPQVDITGKKTYTDPFSIKNTDIKGMKATVGFQLRLLIFRLYGSYTLSKYNYFNAGIGLGIGK
jgi:hypothetical protein